MKYSPKIIAPVNSFEEIKILHNAGANEFYGGYLPSYWEKKYSFLCSPSGRTFKEAHIIEFNNLKKIINYCKKNGLVFSLTLNAPLYLPEQYPLLFKLIEEYTGAGGENIIAADIGLILSLQEKQYPVILHLGTSGAVLNHFTAMFYKEMGIKRIVLERQLTVAEITEIVNCVTDVKFDVFILIGKCPNIEGLCTFLHDSPDRNWHC
ncbi:U32 family peptidase, partial [Candidatus Desantisbacteria bacterium]|nr:U32 family peptidase [Candidatus Desantisbacteria bacterium]